MKLAIDLFQWKSSLTDYVTELHSSPLQKILTLVQSSVGKFYCNADIFEKLHPINRKHMASLLMLRLLHLFIYTAFLLEVTWTFDLHDD